MRSHKESEMKKNEDKVWVKLCESKNAEVYSATLVMNIGTGSVVRVTTFYKDRVAEALTFVPYTTWGTPIEPDLPDGDPGMSPDGYTNDEEP